MTSKIFALEKPIVPSRESIENGVRRFVFHAEDDKGKVTINQSAIVDFMKWKGILKFWYSKRDFDLVMVRGNIVELITVDRIKKEFGDYIKERMPEHIYNKFIANLKSLISKDSLISLLDNFDENRFLKSDCNTGWMFYKNGAVKVTSQKIELQKYEQLNGVVWYEKIIDRDFAIGGDNVDCDTRRFVQLIASDNSDNEKCFRLALGYLMHSYKDPANPKAIILNDQSYSATETVPQGGSGKGLLIKMLDTVKEVTTIDGKTFKADKNFAFQRITPQTEIMCIEDVTRTFNFEQFFSIVTEGITVEKKGKDEHHIPYELSPKVIITSNYAIKGKGRSHERRRHELELSDYFNRKKSPLCEFGHRLFEDWTTEEWCRFDNYMVECLRMFLSGGLVEPTTVNLDKKKLIANTHPDFVDFMDEWKEANDLPVRVAKQDLRNEFVKQSPVNEKISPRFFTQWIKWWCSANGIEVDERNKDEQGRMAYAFK